MRVAGSQESVELEGTTEEEKMMTCVQSCREVTLEGRTSCRVEGPAGSPGSAQRNMRKVSWPQSSPPAPQEEAEVSSSKNRNEQRVEGGFERDVMMCL